MGKNIFTIIKEKLKYYILCHNFQQNNRKMFSFSKNNNYKCLFSRILQGTREIWFSIREGFQSDNAKENSYKFARFQNFSEGGVQLSGSDKLEDDVDDNEPSSSGGRFENPLYKSKRESKKELGVEKIKEIDFNSPVSLVSLSNQIEGGNLEELELTKEEVSETEQ